MFSRPLRGLLPTAMALASCNAINGSDGLTTAVTVPTDASDDVVGFPPADADPDTRALVDGGTDAADGSGGTSLCNPSDPSLLLCLLVEQRRLPVVAGASGRVTVNAPSRRSYP